MMAPINVTMFGVMPRGASHLVTRKAGRGQRCLVTRSVAPL